MIALLKAADIAVARVCKWGVIAALSVLFFLLLAGVVTRAVPFVSITGYDEIVELLIAWMTFIGAVALWREGALYNVTLLLVAVSRPLRLALEILIRLLMLAFALILLVKGYEFAAGSGETTPFLRFDKVYWYASIPVAGALMVAYSIAGLVLAMRGHFDQSEPSGGLLG
ncbi:TRAP transporter small permease [Acuticoccus sp. M5D2P5]|uniref:TRAP transporter small permease n=1 Tax=Acuticoccus kalidii TaxID=2910977 RepID=UPI001F18530E|nr:TRAP transporter small permease subunit [Acuticoccus kalidii]MCF3933597.1 TRAP transporter small permease [Acuticoccus kalidii]